VQVTLHHFIANDLMFLKLKPRDTLKFTFCLFLYVINIYDLTCLKNLKISLYLIITSIKKQQHKTEKYKEPPQMHKDAINKA